MVSLIERCSSSSPLIPTLFSASALTSLVSTHPRLLPCGWARRSHHVWWWHSSQHAATCNLHWDAATSSESAPTHPSSSMSNRHIFINCCPFYCQPRAWSRAPQVNRSLSLSKSLWFLSAAYRVFFLSKKQTDKNPKQQKQQTNKNKKTFLTFIILI